MVVETTSWPDRPAVRAGICAYFLLVLTILSALCALRLASIASWKQFRKLGLARQLILLILLDSWLFCYASALLLFGVGSGLNAVACSVGIWWCLLLYFSNKFMIYLFLMERLRIVHAKSKEMVTLRDRFSSWWTRGAAVLLTGWVGVLIVMIIGRNSMWRDNGECQIGLKLYSTVSILTMDAAVIIYLTVGFVIPLFSAGFAKAKSLVKQSCFAALAALVTTFVNVLLMAIMHGHEMSYVCLSSCVADVTLNAVILWYVTRHGAKDTMSDPTVGSRMASVCRPSMVRRSSSRTSSTMGAPGGTGPTSACFGDGLPVCRTPYSLVDIPDSKAPVFVLPALLGPVLVGGTLPTDIRPGYSPKSTELTVEIV